MKKTAQEAQIENIYRLEGRVPVAKAIPFGLQHVLAMFVANIAPLIIISSVAVYNGQPFTAVETARLLQNCMLIAGIGTLLQLYPVWKIGSGLPVVMGISFTFLAACLATASQDYGIMVGAIIVGGCFEGILGLTAKYWRRLISPIVSACVVVSIGLSILNVGVSSFGSSSAYPLGSWQNLLVATITLAAALVFHTTLKGVAKQLYVLLGMMVGYVVSIFFGMVDFAGMGSTIRELGIVAVPQLFAFKPQFQLGAILSFCLVFIVSAVETIGDTTACCTGGLCRSNGDEAAHVRASAVGDGDDRPVGGGPPESQQNGVLRFGVQISGDLVQKQQLGVRRHSPGDGQQLPLALGEDAWGAGSVQPLFQAADGFVQSGQADRRLYLFLRDGGVVEGDLVPDGAGHPVEALLHAAEELPPF